MSVTRATIAVGILLYLALWGVALDGSTGLIEPLVVPLVLAVMVALGVALQRYMGLPARKQHFSDPEDDATP